MLFKEILVVVLLSQYFSADPWLEMAAEGKSYNQWLEKVERLLDQ